MSTFSSTAKGNLVLACSLPVSCGVVTVYLARDRLSSQFMGYTGV